MSYWNYRTMKNSHDEIVIAEVYYDETDEIQGWAIGSTGAAYDSPGMRPWGEDVETLREILDLMSMACDKPLLVEAEILAAMEEEEGIGC